MLREKFHKTDFASKALISSRFTTDVRQNRKNVKSEKTLERISNSEGSMHFLRIGKQVGKSACIMK